jgi:PAS domain S-box-containing protein
MPEGYDARIVVGPFARVEEADDGACHLLGYSRSDLIGLHGTEIVPSEQHFGVAVSFDRMRTGDATRRRGMLLRKDGTRVAVDIHAVPLPNGHIEFRINAVADESFGT